MHFSLFHATGSLSTIFIWEFWTSVFQWAVKSTEYSFMFLYLALWYNYATWTNEMQTFQINTWIQFFNFRHFLHVSNCPENEPMRSETCSQKLNRRINLKSVHFIGSCCIRIFWQYSHRKQTSPCLILNSLLFDDSYKGKKGTCPSDLAVVLSGTHNTHLVTLSSMSVAHYLLAFFQHPFVFSFALMQLHNFNICSLMCLSFSNISSVSQ